MGRKRKSQITSCLRKITTPFIQGATYSNNPELLVREAGKVISGPLWNAQDEHTCEPVVPVVILIFLLLICFLDAVNSCFLLLAEGVLLIGDKKEDPSVLEDAKEDLVKKQEVMLARSRHGPGDSSVV